MKALTIKKRLESRYNGSKNTKAYQILVDLTSATNNTFLVYGNEIRPVHTSGSKRFIKNLDYTQAVCSLLDLVGLKYEVGNDSPRVGKTGTYIKVLTKIEY